MDMLAGEIRLTKIEFADHSKPGDLRGTATVRINLLLGPGAFEVELPVSGHDGTTLLASAQVAFQRLAARLGEQAAAGAGFWG